MKQADAERVAGEARIVEIARELTAAEEERAQTAERFVSMTSQRQDLLDSIRDDPASAFAYFGWGRTRR